MGYRGGRVPRFAKMEFPTYDGKGNPVEWLQRCEDFFEEQQTPTEAWVRQATFSLQGWASGWYHNLRRMKTRLNWFEFSEECKIRFGPLMSMNPLGELTRLRQTCTEAKTESQQGGAEIVKFEVRNPTLKRLTATEMAERRAKGLCFNCDDMFSIDHKCVKLFGIMLEDEEDVTWDDRAVFTNTYSGFELADKLNAKEGSNVMNRTW
uniref:Retrotransposon gag domain-containing protein n=1 Tax=Lactuca sativa TaxID=4236 RepID=A0A9R1WB17_LACSA|nr:hypothetical protein LSAT_V11C200051600 [Lactuca sativa]